MIEYGFIKPLNALTPHECVIDSVGFPGADKVLPKENCTLVIKDLHKVEYSFQHEYSSSRKTHLLKDGWSTFLNHKRLSPGDSLVFLKTRHDGITLGIRRGEYFAGLGNERIKRQMLTLSAVAEAVGKALRKIEFEAVVYPQPDASLFIHESHEVDAAVAMEWVPGMQVKKLFISKEMMSKRDFRYGYIRSLTKDANMWSALQVTWEDDGDSASANPWEIEFGVPTVPNQKRKRMRLFGYNIEE